MGRKRKALLPESKKESIAPATHAAAAGPLSSVSAQEPLVEDSAATAILTIRGLITRIFFSQPNFSCGLVKGQDDNKSFAFEGPFYVREGDLVLWQGNWTTSKKHGKRFSVQKIVYEEKLDKEGLAHYLANNPNMKGLGPVKARKIAEAFGEDFDKVINEEPGKIAEMAGLSDLKMAQIREEWNAYRDLNSALTALSRFGLTYNQVKKLTERFGRNSVAILNDNPYLMIGEVDNFGFKRIDEIALKTGVDKKNINRLRAGIQFCIQNEIESGHCWVEFPELLKMANKNLIIDSLDSKEIIERALQEQVKAGKLACIEMDGRQLVTMPFMYRVECDLADWFSEGRGFNPHFVKDGGLEERIKRKYPTLNEKQMEAVMLALKHKQVLISGPAGSGKAQPLDADVLTPTGFRKMGDLKVGDEVLCPDNTVSKIDGVYPQGEIDIYKVIFSDETSTECSLDHLWLTQTSLDRWARSNKGRPGSVKSLKEIKDTILYGKSNRLNHTIPMVKEIDFLSEISLPIEPYFLGLLLGNGCFRNGVSISTGEREVLEYCNIYAASIKMKMRQEKSNKYDYAFVKEGERHFGQNFIIEIMRKFGLYGLKAETKFIPEEYLYTSASNRLDLLAGLLDTDGHIEKGIAIEFSSASEKLALGVKFLVESVGGKATHTIKEEPTYTYKGEKRIGQPAHRIWISMPSHINPFRLKRKAERVKPRSKYPPTRYIETVEYVGKKQAQCISIAHPSHLYITNNFIVTHNTYVSDVLCNLYEGRGKKVRLLAPTGRAAKRLSQLSNRKAETIHRFVGYNGFTFTRPENTYADCDLVIVDETSMADAQLIWEFFKAIDRSRTCVVFLGDHHQLAAVGAGNILRDLIERKPLPAVILTEVVRQAGLLRDNSFQILKGEVAPTVPPVTKENAKIESPWIISKITAPDSQDSTTITRQAVLSLYDKILFDQMGFDLINDVQLIIPQKKGPIGVERMNLELQRLIQKKLYGFEIPEMGAANFGTMADPNFKSIPFYIHDRVIHTRKNNYDLNIMNGEMGVVVAISKEEVVVRFEGRDVTFNKTEALNLELAYALTIHKMQGSEAPCIVTIIHKAHQFTHDRNLFYTAVTRARKSAFIFGDPWGLKYCAQQQKSILRRTFLSLLPFKEAWDK